MTIWPERKRSKKNLEEKIDPWVPGEKKLSGLMIILHFEKVVQVEVID